MKKKANIELCESELKQIIAEYFGVSDKNDIFFKVTMGQMDQEIVTCTVQKEIEFPQTITLGSRPNWWPEGAREIPYVQPTQPVDTSKGPSDPIYPHDPFAPYVTWSDRTDATYTVASGSTANTKGENK